jgi:hypothetical protein
MNMQTQKPYTVEKDIIESLQSAAMLVRFTSSAFGTQATSRDKSMELTQKEEASRDAAKVVVNKLPGVARQHHQHITHLQGEARQIINRLTTPWDESGWRLLMTTNFERLARALHPLKEDFDRSLARYKEIAPDVLQQARGELGGLADTIRMPTPDEMVSRYSMKYDIVPIPDGAGFNGLPAGVRDVLSNRLQQTIRSSYEAGVASVMNRLKPLLEAAVERLTAYDKRLSQQAAGIEVGRHGAFRDSLIENFMPVITVLDALDIAGDSRIQEMSRRVKHIASHSPQQLRDDDHARAVVKDGAKEILDLMDQWGV